MRAVHANCDRVRGWVSAELDAELSPFERALLEGHLSSCPSCREFQAGITGITRALRAAPHERLERTVEVARRRRRVSLRLAPAAAAMAIAAVGLGSILASSQFRSGSVGSAPLQNEAAAAVAIPDTLDLRTAQVVQRDAIAKARVATASLSSLRGGPVVLER